MFAALVKANKSALANQGDDTKQTSGGNINNNATSSLATFGKKLTSGTRGVSPPQQQSTATTTVIPLSPELTQVFQSIEWDPEIYGVGVRSIDEQHQQLIQTIMKLCTLGKNVAQNKLNPLIVSSSFGGGGGGTKDGSSSSSSSPPRTGTTTTTMLTSGSTPDKLGASVTSPMTLRGALGLELKSFQSDNEKNNNNKTASNSNTVLNQSTTNRRKSTNALNGGAADGGGDFDPNSSSTLVIDNVDDYNNIKASNHVFGHRVTLAEGACRTIDRGNPPDFQKGGRIEPLILALVNHCSSKLIQEEHALEAVSFSDRGPHAAEHQIFVREAFRAHQLMEGYNFEMSDLVKLVRFLKSWVREHIPKDRRYAPLMLEKQSSLAAGKV